MKLKGGMLYYTLFLMIISMSIITLLIMRGFLFNKTFLDNVKTDELERNVSSALKIYCEGIGLFSQADSCVLDLYEDSTSIVTLKKEKWGVYDLITASCNWKNKTIHRSGLYGTDMVRGENLALYLTDSGINLSISGSTLIKGSCYVPQGRIKSASVEGHPFIYQKITEGQVKSSDKVLPEIDPEVQGAILSLFTNLAPDFSIADLKSTRTDYVENSFNKRTITYYDETSISLAEMIFKSNIIIASAGTITIDNSTNLENVIILARKIIVKEGFSGSFQGFALESINIEKGVCLRYPSILALVQDKARKLTGSNLSVTLDGNSIVSGGIIVITDDNSGSVRISKSFVVYGQVYCSGSVELSGEVYGSLYCNAFNFRASRTSYTNHVLNAIMDFSRLPAGFSGLEFNGQNPKKSLIKWVN